MKNLFDPYPDEQLPPIQRPNEELWANVDCPACFTPFSIITEYSDLFEIDLQYCRACGYPYFNNGQLTEEGQRLKDELTDN